LTAHWRGREKQKMEGQTGSHLRNRKNKGKREGEENLSHRLGGRAETPGDAFWSWPTEVKKKGGEGVSTRQATSPTKNRERKKE